MARQRICRNPVDAWHEASQSSGGASSPDDDTNTDGEPESSSPPALWPRFPAASLSANAPGTDRETVRLPGDRVVLAVLEALQAW